VVVEVEEEEEESDDGSARVHRVPARTALHHERLNSYDPRSS
jgi:hypothetical protein